jgi:hypothetical protein
MHNICGRNGHSRFVFNMYICSKVDDGMVTQNDKKIERSVQDPFQLLQESQRKFFDQVVFSHVNGV